MDARHAKRGLVVLRLLDTYEEMAQACRDNWETECTCPLRGVFKCPFFSLEMACHRITASDWEGISIKEDADGR